ncbi:hypothetical protein LGQ02_09265 [Bacillus shivajii]|uniref:hypothetical protein n=1 Tax=Bacillus shivajii TaxID=1983719 RepID=UPI001CFBD976|nr:hypothetical protein [Bacillus shivajii]UCZ54911.1 hypothetical protein LGQ02_09265 [Bacillus shivajii]
MLRNNKKWIIVVSISTIILLFFIYFNFIKDDIAYQTHGFGGVIIEEKEYHVEPGGYTEMWIVVYNAYDSNENTERYKVMIKDSRIFNLIEEGEEYFMDIASYKQDSDGEFIYKINQISPNPDGTNLMGEGRM